MKKLFLAASWHKLVMANYTIDPQILIPYLPSKTELDLFEGKCFVSLIGFMFLDTKLKGIPIPFHQKFEEVNLRFYVRHKSGNEWKRGTVFIKEIVPKFLVSLVANTLYGEHYETRQMAHLWKMGKDKIEVEYAWKTANWHRIKIESEAELKEITQGSEMEFITEHYWGYTKLSETKTSEYGVEHPRWQVYKTINYEIDCNFDQNYGQSFSFLNYQKPSSVFLVKGSEILVREGSQIGSV